MHSRVSGHRDNRHSQGRRFCDRYRLIDTNPTVHHLHLNDQWRENYNCAVNTCSNKNIFNISLKVQLVVPNHFKVKDTGDKVSILYTWKCTRVTNSQWTITLPSDVVDLAQQQ